MYVPAILEHHLVVIARRRPDLVPTDAGSSDLRLAFTLAGG
jgi:hypothetical protein